MYTFNNGKLSKFLLQERNNPKIEGITNENILIAADLAKTALSGTRHETLCQELHKNSDLFVSTNVAFSFIVWRTIMLTGQL